MQRCAAQLDRQFGESSTGTQLKSQPHTHKPGPWEATSRQTAPPQPPAASPTSLPSASNVSNLIDIERSYQSNRDRKQKCNAKRRALIEWFT